MNLRDHTLENQMLGHLLYKKIIKVNFKTNNYWIPVDPKLEAPASEDFEFVTNTWMISKKLNMFIKKLLDGAVFVLSKLKKNLFTKLGSSMYQQTLGTYFIPYCIIKIVNNIFFQNIPAIEMNIFFRTITKINFTDVFRSYSFRKILIENMEKITKIFAAKKSPLDQPLRTVRIQYFTL